jgi:hypothetical protein
MRVLPPSQISVNACTEFANEEFPRVVRIITALLKPYWEIGIVEALANKLGVPSCHED